MLNVPVGVPICILCLLAACSAAPPARYVVSHDPALSPKNGVLLLSDVCIQKDAIGEDSDFFVLAESRLAAQVLLKNLRAYVEDSNIPIREEVSAVCAAKHGSAETILVGDNFDAQPYRAVQPLYVQQRIEHDKQYVEAISTISTYAFERAAVDKSDSDAAKTLHVKPIAFMEAADIVKSRTHASSLLYLGALGTSRTAAKAVVQGVTTMTVGTVTGIATAGLGGDYYVMFIPGQQVSGRIMEAALIDLDSGELIWSNAVNSSSGDPIEAETWEEQYALDLLFHDLLFKRVTSQ